MIKGINRIKDFGIFSDYKSPNEIEGFAEKNIIYGWNYSGKTTLSRLFYSLGNGEVHKDFNNASFSIVCSDGSTVTEENVSSFSTTVRVFNSDFVAENLSWEGDSFEPILLLGDESIEAQKEIKLNENLIERCREGYSATKKRNAEMEVSIRDAKTKKANQIKTTLSLVETFTATHISQILPVVQSSPEEYLQDGEQLHSILQKAIASESDKLLPVGNYTINGNLTESLQGVDELLLKTPEMANVITYLAENNDVSRWVRTGLDLHQDKGVCEFCGNALELERLGVLKSHFSKDLQEHETKIKNKIRKNQQLTISIQLKHIKDFYPLFHSDLKEKHSELVSVIKDHNNQIEITIDLLTKKLGSQYKEIILPKINEDIDLKVKELVADLNNIIKKNNDITQNFSKQKKNAINTLKKHYVAEYVIENDLAKRRSIQLMLSRHLHVYQNYANLKKSLNQELEAKISDAQKGREELNQFIDKFLGHSNIKIEVIQKDNEPERFILIRNGERARNLSEGEKTAVAFSFFLVKLKEITNLDETVVYIDDPISSLDSNHLFQVNAVIKDFFFWQDESNENEWKLTVKQIFFSTHNFEFLSLLKELPMGKDKKTKYYLVKRVSTKKTSLINLPASIKKYSSEYHYLWNVIHSFYVSDNKDDIEVLLGLPNAMRRFIELYTYSKIPSSSSTTVDNRADVLFGTEKSKRIMKVLHHFSHLNNIHRMAQNNDLISDIENVVIDLVEYVRLDSLHYEALMESI